jgi:hypothetical protein
MRYALHSPHNNTNISVFKNTQQNRKNSRTPVNLVNPIPRQAVFFQKKASTEYHLNTYWMVKTVSGGKLCEPVAIHVQSVLMRNCDRAIRKLETDRSVSH